MSNGRGKKKKKNPVKNPVNQEVVFSAKEVFSMMEDTSQIIAQENSTRLSAMGPAASESGTLTDSVEFWSWMNRNYEKSGHFASSESMRSYMAGTPGQQNWAKKVVQGKGYEWDWMSAQRRSFKNLFKTFDAGDVANRPGSDITVHDILTGTETEQQLKAYTSKNKPHLKNTPKDMTLPKYEIIGTGPRVYFPALKSALKDQPKVPKHQNKDKHGALDDAMVLRIIEKLKEQPDISQEALGESMGVTRRVVQKYINVLKEARRIERVGGKRYGHWKIND